MTIKELKKILAQAPDDDREIYIPEPLHSVDAPIEKIRWGSTTKIHASYDDNCDLELFQTS